MATSAIREIHGLKTTRRSALVMVALDSSGVRLLKAIPFMIDVPGSRLLQSDPEDTAAIMEYFK